jgi:hypothetical protein
MLPTASYNVARGRRPDTELLILPDSIDDVAEIICEAHAPSNGIEQSKGTAPVRQQQNREQQ